MKHSAAISRLEDNRLADSAPSRTGDEISVALDMTFPNRVRGGSSVYAGALLAKLGELPGVSVRSIADPSKGGAPAALRWLMWGADIEATSSGADVLHCPAFIAPWRSRLPLVITIHDAAALRFPAEFAPEWRIYNRYFLPAVARRAAAVLVGTESSRSDVTHFYGLDSKRVVVTPYGVDEIFRQNLAPQSIAGERKAVMRDSEGPLLLFSGAPLPRKNLDIILRVMSNAAAGTMLSRSTLAITGAAPDHYPTYQSRIAALGLSHRVVWLGQLPLERLALVYAAVDVLVYPSYYEGFGLPPLEAMSSGTPVVASNRSCLPEVLGDAALLVDPDDDAGLGAAIESVLHDAAVRSGLVARGRRRTALYTWERCAGETLQVYRRVVSRSRKKVAG